jgi:hypothetical protein
MHGTPEVPAHQFAVHRRSCTGNLHLNPENILKLISDN